MTKVPQNSNIQITFDDIQYNIQPSTVDLTAMDDIIVSIAKGSSSATPMTVIKYSVSSAKFTIDNTLKSVTVSLTAAEATETTGKYYANLWLVANGEYVTHLRKVFEVESVVNYE